MQESMNLKAEVLQKLNVEIFLNWDIKIMEAYECIFLLQNFYNTFAC